MGHAGADGNTGKVQFKEIPGPAYVSATVPGRGVRPQNAFPLKDASGAIPNIGPIKGATAYGAHCQRGQLLLALPAVCCVCLGKGQEPEYRGHSSNQECSNQVDTAAANRAGALHARVLRAGLSRDPM